MFSSIEPDGVRWADGAFQQADAIIWATGFRPELRHLAPLKLREKEGGIAVGQGASWRNPRMFFAGLRADRIHDRREPRRPHDRAAGRRDAEQPAPRPWLS